MERVCTVNIEQAITGLLTDLGLSLDDLRGQGYDGASTMSGEKSGVQRRIMEKQPKALYTHCSSHSLNLVIAQACADPSETVFLLSRPSLIGLKHHQKGKVS